MPVDSNYPVAKRSFLPIYILVPLFFLWAFCVLRVHYQDIRLFDIPLEIFLKILRVPFPLNLEAFLRHIFRFFCLIGMVVSIWGAGKTASRWLKINWDNPFEEAAIKLGLGLGVLSYATLFLGLLGLLYIPIIYILLFFSAAVGLLDLINALKRWRNFKNHKQSKRSFPVFFKILFLGALVTAFFLEIPFLLAPETFYDALVYHLNLPNLYILNHRIYPTPNNLYSGIPFTAQMLYILAMALNGPVLARLLHFSIGLATALVFFSLAHRWKQKGVGLLASAFFFLTPIVLYEFYRTSVGLEWAFFQMIAIYSLLVAIEEPEDSLMRKKWWLLCGIFTGLAMGTKYPAWALPFAVFLVFLFLKVKRNTRFFIRTREMILVFGIALLILSPWIFKNILFYKNPVFPYFQDKFVSSTEEKAAWLKKRHTVTSKEDIDWRALSRDAGSRNTIKIFTTIDGFKNYLVHPWKFSTQVGLYESDYIGPLFLILLPILFLFKRDHLPSAILAVVCLGIWIPLSLATVTPRFFLPHLAPLSFLVSYAVMRIPSSRFLSSALILSALILWVNLFKTFVISPATHLWDVVSGRQSEDEYLCRARTTYSTPQYAGIKFINENTHKDSKIVLIGDVRGLYLKRRYISSSVLNTQVFEDLLNSSKSPEDLKKKLRDSGITHFLVNQGELARLRTRLYISEQGKKNYDAFWNKYTSKVFEDYDPNSHKVMVYKVLNEKESKIPHETDDIFVTVFNLRPVK